jgi:hypothetical protein
VGDPVGLDPGVGEGLTLDDLADLGTDKALDAAFQRPGEPAEPVGHLGTQPPLGQRVDRLVGQALDIQVGEDLGGDLVGDGGLDGRVGGQRGHRADIASVLVTWLRAHTATPANGASTQPTTISRVATMVRHRCRPAGPGPATPGSSPLRAECWFMVRHPLLASGASASPVVGDSKNEPGPAGNSHIRPGNRTRPSPGQQHRAPVGASAADGGERWMLLSLVPADLDGDASPSPLGP